VLAKLKHYVFPENPLDGRTLSRVKRGIIHYAHTGGRSAIPPMQRWIRRHSFEFRHGRNGSSTRVRLSADDLTHLWVADEVLSENVYELDAVPFVPELVLDLGANIGLFTLLAAVRWPGAQFVCVEPHPVTFDHLCENLALNNVRATRLQCAVAASSGVQYLCNEGAVFQALTSQRSATPVWTVPPGSLLPVSPPLRTVIKMDIEGAEETVLGALAQPLPPACFIFIELHRGDTSIEWIKSWAAAHQFEFTQVRRRDDEPA